jgi:tryptophan synthase alpha chain
MSRIQDCFAELAANNKKALIPYITAGDPQPDVTLPLMHALVEAGADLLEVGVPFSDPMADGPVIQAAHERALLHHVSLHQVLEMVSAFRQTDPDTPIILMGYLNPIEVWGYAGFAEAAVAAGVDGILTVDMPPEESEDFVKQLNKHGLDAIFLLAPTSNDKRIMNVVKTASGFIYYVSFKGVTGANRLDVGSVAEKLTLVRQYTDLPIGVGFGVSDADSAAAVAGVADAVIVGSRLVKVIAEHATEPDRIPAAVAEILGEMKTAVNRA